MASASLWATMDWFLADAARADDVVVVQAGQAGIEPLGTQLLDIYSDSLVGIVDELPGEVVAVLDGDLEAGTVFDGCHGGDAP